MTPDDLDRWIFGDPGNWSAELAALVETVRPQFGEWFVEGGEAGMDRLHAAASFMVSNPEIQTQLDAYTFKFAAQVGGTFAQDLRDTLKEGLDSGESAAQLRKRVIAAGHGTISDYKAAMIARRESVNAMEMGAHEAYRQQGVPATVWRAGPSACEFCIALDGKVISIDESYARVGDSVHVDVDGKQRAFRVGYEDVRWPPLHPFCLPGDAEVTSCGRISAYSERWYDGEVVILGTARGYDLTLTPNHPVLTPGGWVAAGLLDIGSSVISVPVRERVVSGYKEGQQMPARIEDIADALRRSGNMPAIQVPLAAKDFHGDGAGSKVAVIGANRPLRDAGDATRRKHAHKLPFSLAYVARSVLPCLGALDKARKRDGRATDGIVRGLRQPLALLSRRLSHAEKHRLALVAGRNASRYEYASDNRAGHGKGIGKGFLGLAADVAGDNLCIGQVPPLVSLNSGGVQLAGDAGLLTVEFGSDLRDRLPAGVTADEVVSVKRAAFHGMVYNLETESGFYVANGIISHNCRCSADPVELEDLQEMQAAAPADPVTPGDTPPLEF